MGAIQSTCTFNSADSGAGPLSGVIGVTLNTQSVQSHAGDTHITVTAIQITLLSALSLVPCWARVRVINVAQSSCGATGPDILPASGSGPTVTGISPATGPITGGTTATITGTATRRALADGGLGAAQW